MSVARRMLLVAVVVAGVGLPIAPAVAAKPDHALQTAKTQTIQGVYAFEIDTPNLTATEWILFASQAPELPGQSGVRSRLVPAGQPYQDLSERRHALLRARVPVQDAAHRHVVSGRIEWQATLHSRMLVPRKKGEKYAAVIEPSARERAAALAESTTIDFSADDFRAWLKQHRLHQHRQETDLDFARRTFLAIKQQMSYDYADKMDRRASHVCRDDKADCGGMSVLFAAALRANEIPARVLIGRWAKSSKPDTKVDGVAYYQQHIKAEFFAEGIGWVPVDLSSAVMYDKTPEGLQYFGRDWGDFLTVQLDPDLRIDTVHFGEQSLPLLQSFHYYVNGTGKLEGATMKSDWKVEKIE